MVGVNFRMRQVIITLHRPLGLAPTAPTSVREEGPKHHPVAFQHTVQRHAWRLRPRDHRLIRRHRDGPHVLRRLARHYKKNSRQGKRGSVRAAQIQFMNIEFVGSRFETTPCCQEDQTDQKRSLSITNHSVEINQSNGLKLALNCSLFFSSFQGEGEVLGGGGGC